MDLSCIISSGDLELYVLGMLPPEEAHKIAQLALLFPEIQQELDTISASLLQAADTAQVAPSPALKGRLMQQLQDLKREEEAHVAPVVPIHTGRHLHTEAGPVEDRPVPPEAVPMRKESKLQFWLPAAAMVGVLLALGGVLFLANKNRQYQAEIAAMEQNNRVLNRRVVNLQRDNLAASQMLHMLQSDVYLKIRLTAVPGKPDAMAQVFWNRETKVVFVNDVSLPQAPSGMQYQLWAIVDGNPVDAGLLQGVKNRVQEMKRFERASAFAITLERQGGSPTPTMNQMFVMGSV